MSDIEHPTQTEGTFTRESRGLEFERVAFFSDAIYAIAMTLLVVDIKVPELTQGKNDPMMVLDTLRHNIPEIIGFFLCFWLIGNTWISHHRFMASLHTIGHTLMTLNMFYLAWLDSHHHLPSVDPGCADSHDLRAALLAADLPDLAVPSAPCAAGGAPLPQDGGLT